MSPELWSGEANTCALLYATGLLRSRGTGSSAWRGSKFAAAIMPSITGKPARRRAGAIAPPKPEACGRSSQGFIPRPMAASPVYADRWRAFALEMFRQVGLLSLYSAPALLRFGVERAALTSRIHPRRAGRRLSAMDVEKTIKEVLEQHALIERDLLRRELIERSTGRRRRRVTLPIAGPPQATDPPRRGVAIPRSRRRKLLSIIGRNRVV